ncbi:MAG: TraB/GumN family protein [Cytophagaceae bacterium]|nr:TraB/GumN family protein [Cytophagaceae bacterium]
MNRLLSLVFTLLICFSAQGQKSSLLWAVSGNGLEKPSYLFGTIHIICPRDFSLSPPVQRSLAASQQLALELDFDDPNMMMTMQQMTAMKGGQTLKKMLSETDYQVVENYFRDSLKMNVAMFGTFKPFVLMSLMYTKLLGCQPKSYELEFTQAAKKDKKEVIGLETVAEQMSIFDKIPYEKQAEALVKMIQSGDKARKEFTELVELYKSQNIKKMAKISEQSDFNFEGFEADLLDNRNQHWISIIGREAREKSTFFAVGAAHLGGRKGVIRLLKKAGYQVKAIRE